MKREGKMIVRRVALLLLVAMPYYRSFQIAYSKDEDFSTYTLLPINFYMRQLIGGFYPELYQKDRFFERLGGDQYTITNCEYGYGGIDRYRKIEN